MSDGPNELEISFGSDDNFDGYVVVSGKSGFIPYYRKAALRSAGEQMASADVGIFLP